MQIEKAAVAGTLESSDCMVTVEDGDGNIDLVLESTVIHQYGNQIRHVVLDTLENLGVQNVKIKIVDKRSSGLHHPCKGGSCGIPFRRAVGAAAMGRCDPMRDAKNDYVVP